MRHRVIPTIIGSLALLTMTFGVAVATTTARFNGTDGHRGVQTCFAKKGGALRVVGPTVRCKSSERRLDLALSPVLGSASQSGAITAPQYSTNPRAVRAVSVTFIVPRGHTYEVSIGASATIRQVSSGKCNAGEFGQGGDAELALRLDGNSRSLLGVLFGGTLPELPAGSQAGDMMYPVRAGRHTFSVSLLPSGCHTVNTAGEYQESNAKLAVDFVADLT